MGCAMHHIFFNQTWNKYSSLEVLEITDKNLSKIKVKQKELLYIQKWVFSAMDNLVLTAFSHFFPPKKFKIEVKNP